MTKSESVTQLTEYTDSERTVMIIDSRSDLMELYIPVLGASGWQVVGVTSTPSIYLQKYLQLEPKPQLLMVEYNLETGNIVPVLEQILQENPNQQIVFVTSEKRLLLDKNFLPSSLQHIPVILKSTHTVEDMVKDLDELNYYYPMKSSDQKSN